MHTISFQTFFVWALLLIVHTWNSSPLRSNFLRQQCTRRVYSNCCCSCSFKAEIIKIGQSSHKMYSNNILNFQESTTILNAHTKKVWKLIVCTSDLILIICLHTVKWFQKFLSNTNNSNQYKLFACTQSDIFKYYDLTLIILILIIYLHTVKWFQVLLSNTNNSI